MTTKRPTLNHGRYVRSNHYEPSWIVDNQMGPHALWLTESLTEVLPIEQGMKVLDLGCGKALSSIFLAKEFGAQVWAVDLWTAASDNQERIVAAGVDDLVTPIHAEAHALPFAAGFFDVIVSIDAYQYFGTDDLYLGYLLDFIKVGGTLGIVCPALKTELEQGVPAVLSPFWRWEYWTWHTVPWWVGHWSKTGQVSIDHAGWVEDGWSDWLRFNDVVAPTAEGWWVEEIKTIHEMLTADSGENIGFSRLVATKEHQDWEPAHRLPDHS